MSKGIYSLIAHLDKTLEIEVGSLGRIKFLDGYYVYTGSALNNLESRIERHKKKNKKLRWHIDYLLKRANIIRVVNMETEEKLECEVNKKIGNLSKSYIKDFGCSDCNCKSHLYYLRNLNDALEAVKAVYESVK